jgi:cytochrome b561
MNYSSPQDAYRQIHWLIALLVVLASFSPLLPGRLDSLVLVQKSIL